MSHISRMRRIFKRKYHLTDSTCRPAFAQTLWNIAILCFVWRSWLWKTSWSYSLETIRFEIKMCGRAFSVSIQAYWKYQTIVTVCIFNHASFNLKRARNKLLCLIFNRFYHMYTCTVISHLTRFGESFIYLENAESDIWRDSASVRVSGPSNILLLIAQTMHKYVAYGISSVTWSSAPRQQCRVLISPPIFYIRLFLLFLLLVQAQKWCSVFFVSWHVVLLLCQKVEDSTWSFHSLSCSVPSSGTASIVPGNLEALTDRIPVIIGHIRCNLGALKMGGYKLCIVLLACFVLSAST